MHFNGTGWVATERTQQIHTDTGAINTPTSFGEDAHGNLYITDIDGDVFRLTPVSASFVQNDAGESTKVDTLSASGHGSEGDRIDVSSLIDTNSKLADHQNFDSVDTVFSSQPAELIAAGHGDNDSIADAILAIQSDGLTMQANPTHIGADIL